MTAITVAGGVYHERCIWPDWDQVFGSGGRAAAALTGVVDHVCLHAYATAELAKAFEGNRGLYGFRFTPAPAEQAISFEYIHSLSIPDIRPTVPLIRRQPPLQVSAEVVLRFGMMEGTAVVAADRCVYDPQSAHAPEPFADNGSKARHLAVVANRGELSALGGGSDPLDTARRLVGEGSAEAVVVKAGAAGAHVVEAGGETPVPAFRTDRVWSLGSGDVFAAVFAAQWGVEERPAVEAARLASRAVADYVSTMALPVSPAPSGDFPIAVAKTGLVYLASPFFTIGQRWLVDEARRGLAALGMQVFSPFHDIGSGPAHEVAPADIAALDRSDAVFAILDGLDSGTLFEVGYARAKGKPVYAFAQAVAPEDLKMVEGTGCRLFSDFVTALHHAAWRT
jgi:hypothetical protein